jgi:hypothetical protein
MYTTYFQVCQATYPLGLIEGVRRKNEKGQRKNKQIQEISLRLRWNPTTPHHLNTGKNKLLSHHMLLPDQFTTKDLNQPPLVDCLLELIEKDPDHTQYGGQDQAAIPYLQYRALTAAENKRAADTFKHATECADPQAIGQDHNTTWD